MTLEVKDDNIESVINDETVEPTTDTEPEKVEEQKNTEPEKQDIPDYRPKDDKTSKEDTVSLKKYLDLKKDFKDLKTSLENKSSDNSLTLKELETLAEENNLDAPILKKIADIIKTETLREAEKKIAPILEKERVRESEKAFDKDFKANILSKHPELKEKRDAFKRIAFSPQFLHLKTLDDIRKEFFAGYKPSQVKDTVEGGSKGQSKISETIDFSRMTDEQHSKVLADPVKRAEYYKWRETQVR